MSGDLILYLSLAAGTAALASLAFARDAKWLIRIFVLLLLADFLLLTYYFLAPNFTINYVWSYTSKDLPLVYKLSGVLAGQQGTLLFWAFLIGIGSLWLSEKSNNDFFRRTQIIIISLGLYFVALTLLDSPFQTIYAANPRMDKSLVPADGNGLNPLLIDPWMAVHPPLMFIAYAAMVVPFALAIVYLLTRNRDWITSTVQWCRVSWIFLTLGIAVGGFWSYKVLGWGGFWAWDPVETSSLVPWLLLTGTLHALSEHKKGKYSILAPTLVALSFVLVLYATLVTRSGFFESIHAFGSGEVGRYLVVLIAACSAAALSLAAVRYVKSGEEKEEVQLLSRTNIFYAAILLFIILTFISFWGVTFPALYKLATGNKVGVGIAFFNLWSYPFIIAAMLLLGLGINFKPSEKGRQIKEFAVFAALTIVFAFIKPSEAWNIVDYSAIVTPEKPFLYSFIGSMSSLSFIPPSVYVLYGLFERGREKLKREGPRKIKAAGILAIHLGVVLVLLGAVFSTLFTEELSVSIDAPDKVFYANSYGAKLLDYREYAEYSKEKVELPPALSLSEFYSTNLSHSDAYMVKGRLEQMVGLGDIALLKLTEGDKILWVATRTAGIPEGIDIAAAGVLIFDVEIEDKTYEVMMLSSKIYTSVRAVSETQEIGVEIYGGKSKIGGGVAKVVQYQQGDVKRVMIDRGIFRDAYVIFTGVSGNEIPLTIKIIPLINYLWLGIILFTAGM
ncbi:MAG: cytochrome c biogenesis protein CcsA, partial [Euryarchaeota archaeon]|nr:cytochrome c biogenesis protein CcsA [Euryarchaeota archaeon]